MIELQQICYMAIVAVMHAYRRCFVRRREKQAHGVIEGRKTIRVHAVFRLPFIGMPARIWSPEVVSIRNTSSRRLIRELGSIVASD